MSAVKMTKILATCLLLAAFQAKAEHGGDNPFYFGFAFGFAGAAEECDYYGYNCDGDDTSFKIFGGKRLHENLAFEISYQDLGKLRKTDFNLTTTAESEGINFSLLGIIPFGDFGFLYGKAGYMMSETRYTRIDTGTTVVDDDSDDFTYGVGYAFLFDNRYDLRIEYERLNDLTDAYVAGGSSITVLSFGGTIYLD
jgi:OOP family OmpA-OmpF porin